MKITKFSSARGFEAVGTPGHKRSAPCWPSQNSWLQQLTGLIMPKVISLEMKKNDFTFSPSLDDAGNIASPMKFSKAILAGRNG